MNLLRSSPFMFLRLACLLHSPQRSCCFFWASVGAFFCAFVAFFWACVGALLWARAVALFSVGALPLSWPQATSAAASTMQNNTAGSPFISSSLRELSVNRTDTASSRYHGPHAAAASANTNYLSSLVISR